MATTLRPRNVDLGRHPGLRGRPEDRAGRTINLPLVIGTIIALAFLIPSASYWHDYQLRRNANSLLTTAERFEAEGDLRQAARSLEQYGELTGYSLDSLQRMADALEKIKQPKIDDYRRLARVYQHTLTIKPSLDGNRRRLARILVSIGSYDQAAREAYSLLESDRSDLVALRVLADSLYLRRRFTEALPQYLRVTQLNPADVVAHAMLAACHVQQGELKAAESVINQMVEANPDSADAYFRRYVFLRATSNKDPRKDLSRAVELAPKNLTYLLAAAEQALSDKDFPLAQRLCEQVIDLGAGENAALLEGYLGLGQALEAQGKRPEAVRVWNKGLNVLGNNNFPLNMRIAEALLAEGELSEIPPRINRLKQRSRQMSHAAQGANTREVVTTQQSVDWLEGRYELARGETGPAMARFIAASSSELGDPAVTYQALETLGKVHARRQQWDAASHCFQRAVQLRPDSVESRFELGDTLVRAGRLEEAAKVLDEASRNPNAPTTVWPYLARLHLRIQASRDRESRDWRPFQESLERCRKLGVDPIETAMMEASYLAIDDQYLRASQTILAGQVGIAIRVARSVRTEFVRRALWALPSPRGSKAPPEPRALGAFVTGPKIRFDSARLWVGLAELLEAWGKPARAEEVMRATLNAFPEFGRISLAGSVLLASHGKFDAAMKLLDDALTRAQKDEARELLTARLRLAYQLEDTERVTDCLTRLVAENESDIPSLVQLCEQLVRAGNMQEAQKRLDRLRAIEGEEGTQWRYVAALASLAKATSPNDDAIKEAERLNEEIIARRPTWSRAHGLAASLALRRSDEERAVEELKKAAKLGDNRPETIQKLLRLLVARGELAEGDEYLGRLRQSLVSDPGLTPIALQVVSRNQNFGEAEALARRAIAARPKEAQGYVWLGQVQAAGQKPNEAEASFRKAFELDSGSLEARLALVRFLVSRKRAAEAEPLVREFEKSPGKTARPELPLAYCFTILGKPQEAKQQYLAAMQKYPKDTVVLRNAVAFFLAAGMPEAESTLRQLHEIRPNDSTVQRQQAYWLLTRDDAQSWQTALDLMRDADSLPDMRMRSYLLERLGGPDNLRSAVNVLEEIVSRGAESTLNDRYRLARLYHRMGKRDRAINQMLNVAFDKQAATVHLATAIEFLLEVNRWGGEAEALLKKLEEKEPKSFRTIALRARWLKASGRRTEALGLARGFLSDLNGKPTYPAVLGSTARLLTDMGEMDEAEKLWSDYAKREPLGFAAHASFLRDRGKFDQAANVLLEEAESPDERKRTRALVAICDLGRLTSQPVAQRIDRTLAVARKRYPDLTELTKAMAERALREGRYAEAISLYRTCLAKEPRNMMLLNNTAMALSGVGDHKKALADINRAIELVGPKLELLDTKGLVLLQAQDYQDAIDVLFKVCSDGQATSVHYLHLAIAYARANRPTESRSALDKAKERGINAQALSEGDRQILGELGGLEQKST